MTLQFLPYEYQEVAIPGHPWNHETPQSVLNDVVIFLNGDLLDAKRYPIIAASAKRGAIKLYAKDEKGNFLCRMGKLGKGRFRTRLIRGKVEIYIRKDDANVD